MNILIEGMEMPEYCYECPCCNHENGKCQLYKDGYLSSIERPAVCPLKEIKDGNQNAPTVDDNAYKEGYERGRFDALDAISSVYHGKQYYFLETNGTVYSRDSCKYLTLEDAIYEFAEKFGDDGEGY